jgi:hypothetical protein
MSYLIVKADSLIRIGFVYLQIFLGSNIQQSHNHVSILNGELRTFLILPECSLFSISPLLE